MAVDLDWLVARFDELSRRHPALSMVVVMRPKDLNTVPHDSDEETGFIWPAIELGKYEKQCCTSLDTVKDENDIIVLSRPWYVFPGWTMYGDFNAAWREGYWSIWLHRRYGFDPRIDDDCQRISENMECLDAYLPVLNAATTYLWESVHNASKQWFFEVYTRCSDGRFSSSLPWLLSLCGWCEGQVIRHNPKVRFIADIGIVSMMVLQEMERLRQANGIPKRGDSDAGGSARVDGVYRSDALLIWGGVRYEWLTDTMMDAIELLVKRYPEKVTPSEMENRIGRLPEGGFKKVFKFNRGGKTGMHPVVSLISGRHPQGWSLTK